MFKSSIRYTVLIIVLAIGGGCGQNEEGHEVKILVSGNNNPHIPAVDKRCIDTLTMLDEKRFEASVIFTAKANVIETKIDECLDQIVTEPTAD